MNRKKSQILLKGYAEFLYTKRKKKHVEEQFLTIEDQKELERTESEVNIEKRAFICVVHKGEIVGTVYICPKCRTFYCGKCAKALKKKGDKCWSCETKIVL